jgi:hypothetical protein
MTGFTGNETLAGWKANGDIREFADAGGSVILGAALGTH